MAYFPLFINLEGKLVVVAGGGKIACRRILALEAFGCRIRVLSPSLCGELEKEYEAGRIFWEEKTYEASDLKAGDRPVFVLAASQDRAVNQKIAEDCRSLGIPVNDASAKENCDFYFPGLARRGELVAGITASGTDHKKAAALTAAVRHLLEGRDWEL